MKRTIVLAFSLLCLTGCAGKSAQPDPVPPPIEIEEQTVPPVPQTTAPGTQSSLPAESTGTAADAQTTITALTTETTAPAYSAEITYAEKIIRRWAKLYSGESDGDFISVVLHAR